MVLRRLYAVANAPIFSYYDNNFGDGIVGGPLISVQARSQIAADIALRMLRGERSRDINVQPVGSATPKFDWRQLQRWGISESRLPPGSEISLSRTDRLGAISWANFRDRGCASGAGRVDRLADLRASAPPRAEVSARNSMAELTHMNRVATAGELSASIAHEVNRPLTGMVTRANASLRWLSGETTRSCQGARCTDPHCKHGSSCERYHHKRPVDVQKGHDRTNLRSISTI